MIMELTELNPKTLELLTTYASKKEFGGNIKAALEYLITTYSKPEYQRLADEWRALRQKRLLQEERDFNIQHWNGSKYHKRFDV